MQYIVAFLAHYACTDVAYDACANAAIGSTTVVCMVVSRFVEITPFQMK